MPMRCPVTGCPITYVLSRGLTIALWMYLVGWLTWGVLFLDVTMAHASLWRGHDDPIMMPGMIAGYVVMGLFIAPLYRIASQGLTGSHMLKGLRFAIVLWGIMGLGGSLFFYALHPVSVDILMVHLVDSTLSLLGAGLILGKWGTCTTS